MKTKLTKDFEIMKMTIIMYSVFVAALNTAKHRIVLNHNVR